MPTPEDMTHVQISYENRDRINRFDNTMTQEETISAALDLLEQSRDWPMNENRNAVSPYLTAGMSLGGYAAPLNDDFNMIFSNHESSYV